VKPFTFILPFCLVLASCAELNQFIPADLLGGKGVNATQPQASELNVNAAQEAEPKTVEERYDRRINQARQQCSLSEAGCNKGCLGIGAVGIFSALMGNSAGASSSQAQLQQCSNRCDQAKSTCEQNVAALEQEKSQALAGGSGANSGGAAGGAGLGSGGGISTGGDSPVTCGSTQQESFRMYDRAMAAFLAQNPNQAARGGARDQYQYTYFFSTRGLRILETYRACLSAADFQANTNALVGARDQGKKGCEQLSSSSGSCTPTYPWR
jgi:hypothetical protein